MRHEDFKAEVRAWAERLDVQPLEIHITGMKRKWASCSTRGRVTFDSDLLGLPEPFRREVIVHELVHLKVPNHGPLSARFSKRISVAGRRRARVSEQHCDG
jgi:predicted metal-dependent hydrolase